jgi:hypothetical protein
MQKKKVLKHLGNIGMAIISAIIMTSPASAVDPAQAAGQVIGAEVDTKAAKEALNTTLKMAKSTPAMATATTIVCIACVPAVGVGVSPALCVACGILIAKTLG